jgi:hypothetical protein
MSGDDLAVINVDIPQAVSTVLGVLPKIAQLREAIVVNLPNHPMRSLSCGRRSWSISRTTR